MPRSCSAASASSPWHTARGTRALGPRRGAARAPDGYSLSAAFRDLDAAAAADCVHYGMAPSRNNRGPSRARERDDRGPPRPSQAGARPGAPPPAGGSRDFTDLDAYRRFLVDLLGRRNARRRKPVELERAELRPLPARRTTDFDEATVLVTSSGGFVLRKVFYTVPSRLVGHRLKLRLHDDRLEWTCPGSADG